MNIIYYCYGSAHSSVIAAAIHLGKLPQDRTVQMREIVALPDFDRARNEDLGHLFFKGTDEKGHAVFTAAFGNEQEVMVRFLVSLARINGVNSNQFQFVPALSSINSIAKLGGALSRRYGLVGIGRRLAAWGIRQSYGRLIDLVEETKQKVDDQGEYLSKESIDCLSESAYDRTV
jgi:hypothetical protein